MRNTTRMSVIAIMLFSSAAFANGSNGASGAAGGMGHGHGGGMGGSAGGSGAGSSGGAAGGGGNSNGTSMAWFERGPQNDQPSFEPPQFAKADWNRR